MSNVHIMWRDHPQLIRLVGWIEQSAACGALRRISEEQPLALLAVQTVHLLAICAIVACGWLAGLWLLGAIALPKALSASPARLIQVVYPALAFSALSGLVLIVRRPDRILLSAAFPLKLALIAVGVGLAVGLTRSLRSDPGYWERTPARRAAGGVLGFATIVVWSGVVFAGRWIPFAG